MEKWGIVKPRRPIPRWVEVATPTGWIERGYPMPQVNVKIHGREVDLYWAAQNRALELDGGAFHSDPVQRSIDRQKQRHLESRGVSVDRLTYKVFDADPGAAVDETARKLGFL